MGKKSNPETQFDFILTGFFLEIQIALYLFSCILFSL